MKHDGMGAQSSSTSTRGKILLTVGPVGQTLVKLTLPMLAGIFAMMAFNLTDTYFVSRLGTRPLAAVSFTFPVVLVVNSISLGLGVGAAAIISQAIGAGSDRLTRRLTTDSLVLGILIVAPTVVVGLSTIDPLFRMLGASEDLLPIIHDYMEIWYLGMLFVVIPMVGNNAIRAAGDTKTPAMIMVFAASMNLILDPLLIFGLGPFPRMGVQGAALATVLGRATSFCAAIAVLHVKKRMLDWSRPKVSQMLTSWKSILHVGIPAAGTRLLMPVSMGVFMRLVSGYGHEAVAAVGVGTRVEGFAMLTIMALSSALVPFVGQNWGAQEGGRAAEGIEKSARFAVLWGLVCLAVLVALSGPLARAFSEDPAMIPYLTMFLLVVPIGYGLQGVNFLAVSAFNAVRLPSRAVAISILRLLVLFVPLAWLGGKLAGYRGLLWGVAVANLIAGAVSWFWIHSAIVARAELQPAQVEL